MKFSQYQTLDGYAEVKDLLEVLDFGFKTQEAISTSLADGKVNILDVPNILKPMMAAGAALEGVKNVKKELSELTDDGKYIVFDFVRQQFDIPNDQLESLIESTIDEVIGDITVAFKWSAYRKKAA
jgi:hypothetical protein